MPRVIECRKFYFHVEIFVRDKASNTVETDDKFWESLIEFLTFFAFFLCFLFAFYEAFMKNLTEDL